MRRRRSHDRRDRHELPPPAPPRVADVPAALASLAPGPARARPASLDLAEELSLDPSGQLSTWTVAGIESPIEVLFYRPTADLPGRGGIDAGTGARWTDASSPRDAIVR